MMNDIIFLLFSAVAGINNKKVSVSKGLRIGCLKTPFLGQTRCPIFGLRDYHSYTD